MKEPNNTFCFRKNFLLIVSLPLFHFLPLSSSLSLSLNLSLSTSLSTSHSTSLSLSLFPFLSFFHFLPLSPSLFNSLPLSLPLLPFLSFFHFRPLSSTLSLSLYLSLPSPISLSRSLSPLFLSSISPPLTHTPSYSVFHRFRKSKFVNSDSSWSLKHFLLLPQLPLTVMLFKKSDQNWLQNNYLANLNRWNRLYIHTFASLSYKHRTTHTHTHMLPLFTYMSLTQTNIHTIYNAYFQNLILLLFHIFFRKEEVIKLGRKWKLFSPFLFTV